MQIVFRADSGAQEMPIAGKNIMMHQTFAGRRGAATAAPSEVEALSEKQACALIQYTNT
jgi:hypothetical protein